MMHTYRMEDDGWVVGFECETNFRKIKAFRAESLAAMFASFLNGGTNPTSMSEFVRWEDAA